MTRTSGCGSEGRTLRSCDRDVVDVRLPHAACDFWTRGESASLVPRRATTSSGRATSRPWLRTRDRARTLDTARADAGPHREPARPTATLVRPRLRLRDRDAGLAGARIDELKAGSGSRTHGRPTCRAAGRSAARSVDPRRTGRTTARSARPGPSESATSLRWRRAGCCWRRSARTTPTRRRSRACASRAQLRTKGMRGTRSVSRSQSANTFAIPSSNLGSTSQPRSVSPSASTTALFGGVYTASVRFSRSTTHTSVAPPSR